MFGPPQGQRVTFVHPQDWLGSQRPWEPAEALREVARRYAETYGPVTYRQFREWFTSRHLTPAAVRELFASIDVPEPEPVESRSSVRLLPEYDVYIMGFREREHLVPPEVREQVAAHGKGRYEGPAGTPFLVVDGVCAGIWRRKKTAKRIELTLEPARRLTRVERAAVDHEVERIGAFYGLEPLPFPDQLLHQARVLASRLPGDGSGGAAGADGGRARREGRRLVRPQRPRARWYHTEGRSAFCDFEGDIDFAQVGINVSVLKPGESMGMYHWEADQEDFLVLSGEALLIVEGEERPLRAWDFVHCPPETKHIIVGAGDGPAIVLAIGARERSTGPDWGGYTVDETAATPRCEREEETTDANEAYAGLTRRQPTRHRSEWLG